MKVCEFALCLILWTMTTTRTTTTTMASSSSSSSNNNNDNDEISVAFLGNSILYFNDCPRLVQHMLLTKYTTVHQDSCLCGGATLSSLFKKGNAMEEKFGASSNAMISLNSDGTITSISNTEDKDIGADTVIDLLDHSNQKWDYVVMNDQTQAPAREASRESTATALEEKYGPLFLQEQPQIVPIFLQTAAYRSPAKGSDDLGSVQEFTDALREGYEYYAQVLLENHFVSHVRIAPVGDAYLYVHDHHHALWKRLFYTDNFHPSPHGTWLEACVLYCTITKDVPPKLDKSWFDTQRYTQPSDDMELPCYRDAKLLRDAAIHVCGLE